MNWMAKKNEHYPASLKDLTRCISLYEDLLGWDETITECKTFEELRKNTQRYIERISQLVGVKSRLSQLGQNAIKQLI